MCVCLKSNEEMLHQHETVSPFNPSIIYRLHAQLPVCSWDFTQVHTLTGAHTSVIPCASGVCGNRLADYTLQSHHWSILIHHHSIHSLCCVNCVTLCFDSGSEQTTSLTLVRLWANYLFSFFILHNINFTITIYILAMSF